MASNTLPDQIPSQSVPLTYSDSDGRERVEVDWYLFLYGLWTQVSSIVSGGAVLSPAVNIPMIDSDVFDTDALQAARQALNAQQLLGIDADAGPTMRDLANAFVLAADSLLPDPAPRAQPVAAVAVGASPFVFTAPSNGTLAISAGTVSAVSIIRQGVSVTAGLTDGLVPVSRLDQVQITYAVVPTVNFLPT